MLLEIHFGPHDGATIDLDQPPPVLIHGGETHHLHYGGGWHYCWQPAEAVTPAPQPTGTATPGRRPAR